MFNTTTPVLTKKDTLKFVKQVDLACKMLNEDFLKEVVERFGLQDLEDTPEFLQDAQQNIGFWREEEAGILVEEVEEFTTRCIVCVYGKTVNGYRIHYSVPGPGETRVHYTREIAVNFQIVNERLTDFGWCNAFLNEKEMKDLS